MLELVLCLIFSFCFHFAVCACSANSYLVFVASFGTNGVVEFRQAAPTYPFNTSTTSDLTCATTVTVSLASSSSSQRVLWITSAIADPLIEPVSCSSVNQTIFDPLDCSSATTTVTSGTCVVGAVLATAIGTLSTNTIISKSITTQSIQLAGWSSILGRTVVIKNAVTGEVMDCATIVPINDLQQVRYRATFSNRLNGTVNVLGMIGFPRFGSVIAANLQWQMLETFPTTTTALNWGIVVGDCSQTATVFDPFDKLLSLQSVLICNGTTPADSKYDQMQACASGDLVSKHGHISVSTQGFSVPASVGQFVDSNLLVGSYNGLGGNNTKSVVFFNSSDGSVVDCAMLTRVDSSCSFASYTSSVVSAVVSAPGIFTGTFSFSQPSSFCPTIVSYNLTLAAASSTPYQWSIVTTNNNVSLSNTLSMSSGFIVAVNCSPSFPFNCNIGDLTSKFGGLGPTNNRNSNSNIIIESFTDDFLPLHFSGSVFGRTLVITSASNSSFIATAPIATPATVVTAVFNNSATQPVKVQGTVEFGFSDAGFTAYIASSGLHVLSGLASPVQWEIHQYSSSFSQTCSDLGFVVRVSQFDVPGCDGSQMSRCVEGNLTAKHGSIAINNSFFFPDSNLALSNAHGHSLVLLDNSGTAKACATIGGEIAALCAVSPVSYTGSPGVSPGQWYAKGWDGIASTAYCSLDPKATLSANLPNVHVTQVVLYVIEGLEALAANVTVTLTASDSSTLALQSPGVVAGSQVTLGVSSNRTFVSAEVQSSASAILCLSDVVVYTECSHPSHVSGPSGVHTPSPTPPTSAPSFTVLSKTVTGLEVDSNPTNLPLAVFRADFFRVTSFSLQSVSVSNCDSPYIEGHVAVLNVQPCASLCDSVNGCLFWNQVSSDAIAADCFSFLWALAGCSTDPQPHMLTMLPANTTLATVISTIASLASNSSSNRTLCYQNTTNSGVGCGLVNILDGVSDACAQQVWQSAGCVTDSTTLLGSVWTHTTTLPQLMRAALEYASMHTDDTQSTCYNASSKFEVVCTLIDSQTAVFLVDDNTVVDMQGSAILGTTLTLNSDQSAPTITSFITTVSSGNNFVTMDDDITILLSVSELFAEVVIACLGTLVSCTFNNDDSVCLVSIVPQLSWPDVALRFEVTTKDLVGNSNTTTVTTNVFVDRFAAEVSVMLVGQSEPQYVLTDNVTIHYVLTDNITIHYVVSKQETTFNSTTMALISGCDHRFDLGSVEGEDGTEVFEVLCVGIADGTHLVANVTGSFVDMAGRAGTLASHATVYVVVDLTNPTIRISVLEADPCNYISTTEATVVVETSEPTKPLHLSFDFSLSLMATISLLSVDDSTNTGVPDFYTRTEFFVTLPTTDTVWSHIVFFSLDAFVLTDLANRFNDQPSNNLTLRYGLSPTVKHVKIDETKDVMLYDAVYGIGDTVTLTFSKDTNTAGVCGESCSTQYGSSQARFSCSNKVLNKQWIDNHFVFGASLGTDYIARWTDCATFEIEITNATDHGSIDSLTVAAVDRSFNTTSCADWALRDVYETSPHANQTLSNLTLATVSFGNCSHGAVNAETGKCDCNADYIGASCDTPCQTANTNLTVGDLAFKMGQCTCFPNYNSDDCSFECVEHQGNYFQSRGSDVCLCVAGFVDPACSTSCGPGTYASGVQHCVDCPTGKYSNDTVNTVCTACPLSTYQSSTQQSDCLSCLGNSYTTTLGAQSDLDCIPIGNFFRSKASPINSSFAIVTCAKEGICDYWPDNYDRWTGKTGFTASEDELWCDGEAYFGSCVQCRCDEGDASKPNNAKQCYTGYMCGRCRLGYYRIGETCSRCPNQQGWILAVTVVSSVVLLVVFYKLAPFMESSGTLSLFFTFFQFVSFSQFSIRFPTVLKHFLDGLSFFSINIQLIQPECRSGLLQSHENRFLATLLLPVFAFAIFALLFLFRLFSKRVQFTAVWRKELRRQQSLTASAGSLSMSDQDHVLVPARSMARQQSFRARILQQREQTMRDPQPTEKLTVFERMGYVHDHSSPMLQHTLMVVRKRFEVKQRGNRFEQILAAASLRENLRDVTNMTHTLNLCVNAFMTFLSVIYMIMTVSILSVFNCSFHHDLGEYRLNSEPSITCFTTHGVWGKMMWGAIFGLVVYVIGIPLFIAVTLYRKRRVLDSRASKVRYGFLYQRFSRSWFWWELAVMMRKLVFVTVQLFSGSRTQLTMSCCLFVLFVAICIHVYALPFNSAHLNRLEALLLVGNFTILLSFMQLPSGELNTNEREILAVCVVALICILVAIGVQVMVIELRQRANDLSKSMPKFVQRLISFESKRRARLVEDVEGLAARNLDSSSQTIFNAWLRHAAAYGEIETWRDFFEKFEKFSSGTCVDHSYETQHMPVVHPDKIRHFWHWMSKAREHDLIALSRGLTHIRMFKRWQYENEARVQQFVIDQIKEEVFLNSKPSLSLTPAQQRWNILRRAVVTGRWQKFFPEQSILIARASWASPRRNKQQQRQVTEIQMQTFAHDLLASDASDKQSPTDGRNRGSLQTELEDMSLLGVADRHHQPEDLFSKQDVDGVDDNVSEIVLPQPEQARLTQADPNADQ